MHTQIIGLEGITISEAVRPRHKVGDTVFISTYSETTGPDVICPHCGGMPIFLNSYQRVMRCPKCTDGVLKNGGPKTKVYEVQNFIVAGVNILWAQKPDFFTPEKWQSVTGEDGLLWYRVQYTGWSNYLLGEGSVFKTAEEALAAAEKTSIPRR